MNLRFFPPWIIYSYICFELVSYFYPLSAINEHPCLKSCDTRSQLTCEYNFTVELYYTLSKACYDCPFNKTDCERKHCIAANGVKRPIIVVNRQLPGPSIQVCENDTVIVNLMNQQLGSDVITIHWHGLAMRNTPYMDGVSMLTQCPITPESTFQYKFQAFPSGTHFYHAHSGLQRGDGVFGKLIIRQPKYRDPHSKLYDMDLPEHEIILIDWFNELTITRFAAHHHSNGTNKADSILINGKGEYKSFWHPEMNETIFTPQEIFIVESNKRYRFRLISNGMVNCPIQLSIDEHTLLIIATDGNPIKPLYVESLIIYAGERFDFVINTNQTVNNYWIKAMGLMDCGEKFTKAKQTAILRYIGAPDERPSGNNDYFSMKREGRVLNPVNMKSSPTNITMVDINSFYPHNMSDEKVDFKHFLAFDFNKIDNIMFHHPLYYPIKSIPKEQHLYSPQINNISFMMPSSPIVHQFDQINPESLCNSSTVKNCTDHVCQCTHMLFIPLGAAVELILIDKGFTYDANHPFHLHGNTFRVVATDKLGSNVTLEEVMQLDEAGQIHRKLEDVVLKDTVTVPDGGYTIIRFHATNPGYWLLHCHIEWHMEIGMGLIIKVGEHDDYPPPPNNFPLCGTWMYSEKPPSQPAKALNLCNISYFTDHFSHSLSGATYLFKIELFIIIVLFNILQIIV